MLCPFHLRNIPRNADVLHKACEPETDVFCGVLRAQIYTESLQQLFLDNLTLCKEMQACSYKKLCLVTVMNETDSPSISQGKD